MRNFTTLRGYQVALLGDKHIGVLRGSGKPNSVCGFYRLGDLQLSWVVAGDPLI